MIMETQFAWQDRYYPLMNRISGFKNDGIRDPAYVRAFRFSRTTDSAVTLHVKGSPSWPNWQGQQGLVGGPGYQMLRGLPAGYPLPKRPLPFKMKEKYVNRLSHPSMLQYATNHRRAVMHGNLITMARTMTVPSLGPLSPEGIAALPAARRNAMAAYGVIETIGEPTCLTYVLPFIRDKPQLQSEDAFWLAAVVHADVDSGTCA